MTGPYTHWCVNNIRIPLIVMVTVLSYSGTACNYISKFDINSILNSIFLFHGFIVICIVLLDILINNISSVSLIYVSHIIVCQACEYICESCLR